MSQVIEVFMFKKVNRRNYFKKAGMAAIGTFALAVNPLKIFSKQSSDRKRIKVKIHPSAVSRKVQDI